MEKLTFKANINAPREKVWSVLWNDESYRDWTSVFGEGSHMRTDWKEGDKVLFLGGDGTSGMVSRIARNIPNEYMSFEHLGEMKDGVEDTTSDRVKGWAGSHENYTLKGDGATTELTVELDINEEFKEMFSGLFPKAVDRVKQLAEAN